MNHILGIVQHDRLGGAARLGFMRNQRGIDAVEAVGLGARAITADIHGRHTRVDDAGDGSSRARIIAIMADEQPVIAFAESLEG